MPFSGSGLFFLLLLLFLLFVLGNLSSQTCSSERNNCDQMKSIKHNTSDGSVTLETNTSIPELRDGDVLIKVAAAGVNHLDLLQVKGQYPPPPGESEILGVEVSGVVEALSLLAESKSTLKQGDKVMALIGGGGYAGYVAAPYQCVMPIPTILDFQQAAGIPEVYITAYQALVWNAYLEDGNSVLIHAGASGVGSAAIQLAKAFHNDVTVIATSRTAEKLTVCKKCGADFVINSKEQDFHTEVMRITGGKGVDIIIDFVGGSYWEKNLASVAIDGRIVLLSMLGGAITESPVNLGQILKKRLTIRGSTLRSRSLEYKGQLIQEVSDVVLPLFNSQQLWPLIDSSYPLERCGEAHERMRNNLNSGKIILTM